MEQRIEVDNSLIIANLQQQIANQALHIAMLEAHIASTRPSEAPAEEPAPV